MLGGALFAGFALAVLTGGTLLGRVPALVGVFALPVAIGVAILRYRLFDIDRIISRTLAYAIMTGLLVGVYAGLVLLATRLLSIRSRWRPRRWRPRRCSIRRGTGCSGWWTGGSTEPGTTPTRRWPRSPPGCRTRWTWTR